MAEITREQIEKALKSVLTPKFAEKLQDLTPKHYEWEEDGQKFSCWKIGTMTMGDGAYAEYCRIFKEELDKL